MKPNSRPTKTSCVLLGCLALSCTARAATFSTTTVADTSLYDQNPDFNLGGTSLVSGTTRRAAISRALFRFDLSSLPAGAVVTDVQVTLHVTRTPDPNQGVPVTSDFSLHRLLAGWGEGVGNGLTGSTANTGDATWNERFYETVAWGTGGGLEGEDYATARSAITEVSGVGEYTWGSNSQLVDDVKAWQSDPASNFGFILISEDEGSDSSARRFASIEDSTALAPPAQLTVTYIPEPSVAPLWLMGLSAAVLRRRRKNR